MHYYLPARPFFFFFFGGGWMSSVQLLSCVDSLRPHGLQHARLPCPSLTSESLLKLMSIEWVMPSNHLILCCSLLLLPSIFPSIKVFSSESVLRIRWSKYWSFSISPSNDYLGLISFGKLTGLTSLLSKGLSRVFSNTTVQRHQFFGTQLSQEREMQKCKMVV